ncbi:hypothetical protein CKA32_002337 [Geitlerinema sp. FC II]|nr:hypothetical protein CKA32_002337 [Geitlerinema sp. FC II]
MDGSRPCALRVASSTSRGLTQRDRASNGRTLEFSILETLRVAWMVARSVSGDSRD